MKPPKFTVVGELSDQAVKGFARLCLRVADRKREKAAAERKKSDRKKLSKAS